MIQDPLSSYKLTGSVGDKDSTYAVLELDGENGRSAQVKFYDFGLAGALAELIWELAVDLAQAQTEGIESVAEIKGIEGDSETMTVDDLLDSIANPDNPTNNRTDLAFPWDKKEDDNE